MISQAEHARPLARICAGRQAITLTPTGRAAFITYTAILRSLLSP